MKFRTALTAAIIAFAIIFATSTSASAQVRVGVKGGLVLAKWAIDGPSGIDEDQLQNKTDFFVGGFVSIAGDRPVGAQIEALYIRKGVHADTGVDEGDYKFTYFEIPALASIRLASFANGRVVAHVGPTFAARVDARLVVDGLPDEEFGDDIVKTMDVGLAFGAGLELGRLRIDGRYTHGLTNLLVDDTGGSIKNKAITFGVGVVF
jgi:hypothetical protein